jgi:formamidopyrimidine-DNA glycosylase
MRRYLQATSLHQEIDAVEVIDDVDQFVCERGLGPDVLDPAFDLGAFKELVQGRRVMVKAFLMDQHTVAGIGNVYADEILFQVGVHPRAKINRLDEQTLEDLFRATEDVLEQAIACQAHPDRFPDTFIAPHRHEGGKCPVCGTALEQVKVSSRTAYYCPECQQRSGA